MKVAIWDTYVSKKDGTTMHFDIVVPVEIKNKEQIYTYGRAYIASKGQAGQALTASECRFCHVETAKPIWETVIMQQGYYIIEMENCD